jgi:hypothetical protein
MGMLENPMVSGLRADMARRAEADKRQAHATAWAEEALLHDADTYTDWLGGHCLCQSAVTVPAPKREPENLQMQIDRLTVPQLVVWQMHARSDVRSAACWELRCRFEKENGKRLDQLIDQFLEEGSDE